MSSLCTLLGCSRQAVHKYKNSRVASNLTTELIVQQVLQHRRLQPRIGTRKLMILLEQFIKTHSIKMGRDMLYNMLRERGLLVRKRKTRVQTTFSKHWLKKYPNLIKGMLITMPNLLWVSDITYIRTANSYCYLSLVTDAYSRRIVGFYLSETLEAAGSLNALKMALETCTDTSKLTHHSDRGVQYCSTEYVKILTGNNIRISMTENGDPLENAIAERVNGILKDELLKQEYNSYGQARDHVLMAIEVYNSLRPHSSCDMLTPLKAHEQQGDLKRHWKNYYNKTEVQTNSESYQKM